MLLVISYIDSNAVRAVAKSCVVLGRQGEDRGATTSTQPRNATVAPFYGWWGAA
jgi:hypothetical protein